MITGSVAFGRSYYGNNECFLFSQSMTDEDEDVVELKDPSDPSKLISIRLPYLHIYPSTLKNDYYMLSEADFMALGGGDGRFSLFIDGDLYKGYSSTAPTYSNPRPLCSNENGEYTCMALELWGIVQD